MTDALHDDGKELWLCVQPGQDLDYIDFEDLSENVDRFVALLFDETAEIDSPGPLGSRRWFEGWLHVLLEDADARQWVIVLGNYGYDWMAAGRKRNSSACPEAMSRAELRRGRDGGRVRVPITTLPFEYEDVNTGHTVWFLDGVTFANQLRAFATEGGRHSAIYGWDQRTRRFGTR